MANSSFLPRKRRFLMTIARESAQADFAADRRPPSRRDFNRQPLLAANAPARFPVARLLTRGRFQPYTVQASACAWGLWTAAHRATWPSGKARVCKILITGSNPVVASQSDLANPVLHLKGGIRCVCARRRPI